MIFYPVTFIIAFPFLVAVLQAIILGMDGYRSNPGYRWISLVASLLASVVAIGMIFWIDRHGSGMFLHEGFDWVGSYAIRYDVGVDGLNLPLILLIAVVFPILILAEWGHRAGSRGYHNLFLVLQAAFFGMVTAQDLFLELFFLSLVAFPIYFMIAVFGGPGREKVAFRFLITAVMAALLFFVGLLLVYFSVDPSSLSIADFHRHEIGGHLATVFGSQVSVSSLAFWIFCIAFCCFLPIFPIHGWFSNLAGDAPQIVLVIFCSILIPSVTNVFTRIGYFLFPEELLKYSTFLMFIGAVNLVFGFMCTAGQKQLGRFYSFLAMGEVGILIMGMTSRDSAGVVGAVYSQLSLGLGLAGFGLFLALMNERGEKNLELTETTSTQPLIQKTPAIAVFVGLFSIALLGFPGSGGFIGNALIAMGAQSVSSAFVIVLVCAEMILVYGLFSVFQGVFLTGGVNFIDGSDLSPRERTYLIPLLLMLLFLGVYPKLLLDLIKPTVDALLMAAHA